MIQNRNFLYGLGTGLIVSSILFGVSDLVSSKSALTSQAASASTQAVPSAPKSSVPSSEIQSASANPTQTNQQPSSPVPQNKESVKPSAKVTVEIKEGMMAAQIADMLVQNGVVSDANAFLDAAQEKVNQIRSGTYELPVKGDYGQILHVITTGKAQ